MKKLSKALSMVLAMVLLFTFAVTGCGSNEQKPADTQAATTQALSTTAAETKPELEPVKLVWYMIFPQQQDQEAVFEEFNKRLKEKINAEVEFRTLDWGSYDQKLQTAAAANEEFDMTWISDWMGVKYADFANKGAIIPIDDLMSQYAPKTKEFIAQKFWDLTKIGGKVYGVPCYQMFYRQQGMWVKKDLADKYGFDPNNFKTYADLEPFFAKVKEGETDITPLAANGGYMWWFKNSYGPTPDRGKARQLGGGQNCYEANPSKAVDDLLDPQEYSDTKAKMKVARDWYVKGYTRKDMLALQNMDAEVKAGKFAAGFTMQGPSTAADFKDRNGFEVYSFVTSKPELSGVTATLLSISATSKNPERAMMLIEILNTDKDMYNLLANGIENKHYIKQGDNRIARVEKNTYQPGMNWALGNTYNAFLTPGQPDNYQEIVKKGNDEAEPQFMPDWNFNNEAVKSEDAATGALWNEMGNPLWAGILDPEKELDKYIERMKKAGKEKIAAEVQRQLDEYWKNHK